MRKTILVAAVLAAVAAFGGWFTPDKPDTKARDEVRFMRKGALGNGDYVVSEVYPSLPSYVLVTDPVTQLVDRAVHRYLLERDTVFVVPPEPVKRSVDQYRAARGFILRLSITNAAPPKIGFDGCDRIVSTDGGDAFDLVRGENLLAFTEIGESVFMVECRELTEIRNER